MISHMSLPVSDLEKSKAFYVEALKPLGYAVVMEFPGFVGLGVNGDPDFWLVPGKNPEGLHIAFGAENRALVGAFYEAAMAAGAKDNGGPGLRPHYGENYYGAFVFDLDGHNIEAVCHRPE